MRRRTVVRNGVARLGRPTWQWRWLLLPVLIVPAILVATWRWCIGTDGDA